MTYPHVPHEVWGAGTCTLPIDWQSHGQRLEFHGAKLTIHGGKATMYFHRYNITVDEGAMPVHEAEALARLAQCTRFPYRPYSLNLVEEKPNHWLLTFEV